MCTRVCEWMFATMSTHCKGFLCAALLFATLLVNGCASVPSPPQHRALKRVEALRSAIESHDATAVYAMLHRETRKRISADEFNRYFELHYYDFLDYAALLHARMSAQVLEVFAYVGDDPLGKSRFVWSDNGWVFDGTSHFNPDDTSEALKKDLISAMKTDKFKLIVAQYAERNPQFNEVEQLKLFETIPGLSPQDIVFVGKEARVFFEARPIMRLEFDDLAWRLTQCHLFP